MEGEYGFNPLCSLCSLFLSLSLSLSLCLSVSHLHNTHINPHSRWSLSVRLYEERQWSFIYEFVQTIAFACVFVHAREREKKRES